MRNSEVANYPVYCCIYCMKLVTDDPSLSDMACTCFPVHGQYVAVEFGDGVVGQMLICSVTIKRMRTCNGTQGDK